MKILDKYSHKPQDFFLLLFINFLFGFAPFGLLFGILALLGIEPINFNGNELYGIKGFLVVLFFTPLTAIVFAFFVWIYFVIGNFFLRLFKRIFS